MKRTYVFVFVLAMVLGFYVQAQATLTTIGQAQYGGTNYNLIWDNDGPFGSIVWLDYSKDRDTWLNQWVWADRLNNSGTLTYTINPIYSVTWSDKWRLPKTVDGPYPYAYGYDGTTAEGYNITTNEMGHLYYTELGNKGYVATDGTYPQLGWGLNNTASFKNLQAADYWSGTGCNYAPGSVWFFYFYDGSQNYFNKLSQELYVLAVRPGDVSTVPEPGTMLLLGSGLVTLAGYGRKKFFKK